MIPPKFYAGDTLAFTDIEQTYKANEGWTMHYCLVNETSQHILDSTADGENHAFNIAPTVTEQIPAGEFHYQRYVTNADGDRFTISTGSVEVLADIVAKTHGHDVRSTVKQTLDALQLAVKKKAQLTPDQLKMKVGDKEIGRMGYTELIKAIKQYKAWYKQEQAGVGQDNTSGSFGGMINLRFV